MKLISFIHSNTNNNFCKKKTRTKVVNKNESQRLNKVLKGYLLARRNLLQSYSNRVLFVRCRRTYVLYKSKHNIMIKSNKYKA